jgi:large subunit ribosomal protein L25
MAKSAANQLTATVRTETGKGASRRARREGKIPATPATLAVTPGQGSA